MERIKKFFWWIMLVGVIFLNGIGNGGVVAEATTVEPAYEIGPDSNKVYGEAGKLTYGFVQMDKGTGAGIDMGLIPDVSYKASETEYIRHIYANKTNGKIGITTTSFAVIQTDQEWKSRISKSDSGSVATFLYNPIATALANSQGNPLRKKIVATGHPGNDKDILVTVTMYPNDDDSAIIHEFDIENKSNEKKIVYPIKEVDTELNNYDNVSIYSRGYIEDSSGDYMKNVGKGIYIKTLRDRSDSKSGYYRLDYYTSGELNGDEHFPVAYTANYPNYIPSDLFGPDKDNQGVGLPSDKDFYKQSKTTPGELNEPSVNVTEEETELKNLDVDAWGSKDTALQMSWGRVELAAAGDPGSTYKARYDVGITVETDTKKSKKAINISDRDNPGRQNGKNYAGDIIEYTISYETKKGALSGARITDDLKDVFDDPMYDYSDDENPIINTTTLTHFNADGTKKNSTVYSFDDVNVYNEKTTSGTTTRILTVPPTGSPGVLIDENEKIEVTFRVRLSSKAAGQSVINVANASSLTSESTIVKEEIVSEKAIPVENTGTVTIKYQDELGNELSSDETLTGIIGTDYDTSKVTKPKINGYEFEKLKNGAESGKFSSTPQEVIYQYKENSFEIRQEVFDKDDNNANNQSVEMGGLLKYKTTVSSNLDTSTGIKYKDFTVTANVSPYITVDESSIKFETSKGILLTNVVYNSTTNTITGIIEVSNSIDSDEDLILTYEGAVKNVFDVDVVVNSTAGGTYTTSNPQVLGTLKSSNYVTTKRGAGNLEFTSAPTEFSFGKNNEISSKTKKYSLVSINDSLSITDNREPNNPWSVSVNLTKQFTNTSQGNATFGNKALKYKNSSGTYIDLPQGVETKILSGTTSSADRGRKIDLSKDWVSKKEGLVLEVPANTAKLGDYNAELTWTLYDTMDMTP